MGTLNTCSSYSTCDSCLLDSVCSWCGDSCGNPSVDVCLCFGSACSSGSNWSTTCSSGGLSTLYIVLIVLGVVLFGTVLAVLIRYLKANANQSAQQYSASNGASSYVFLPNEATKCTGCGNSVLKNAMNCPRCGKVV